MNYPETDFNYKCQWVADPSDIFILDVRGNLLSILKQKEPDLWDDYSFSHMIDNVRITEYLQFKYREIKHDYISAISTVLNQESIRNILKNQLFIEEADFQKFILGEINSCFYKYLDNLSLCLKLVLDDSFLSNEISIMFIFEITQFLESKEQKYFIATVDGLLFDKHNFEEVFFRKYLKLLKSILNYDSIDFMEDSILKAYIKYDNSISNEEIKQDMLDYLRNKFFVIEKKKNLKIEEQSINKNPKQKTPVSNINSDEYQSFKFNLDTNKLQVFYQQTVKVYKLFDCTYEVFREAFSGKFLNKHLNIRYLKRVNNGDNPNKVALIFLLKLLESNKIIDPWDNNTLLKIFIDAEGRHFIHMTQSWHTYKNTKYYKNEQFNQLIELLLKP